MTSVCAPSASAAFQPKLPRWLPDVRRRRDLLYERPVGVDRVWVDAFEHVSRALFASAPVAIDSLLDPFRPRPDDEDAVANRQPALAEFRFASHVPVGPTPLRVDDLDPFKL